MQKLKFGRWFFNSSSQKYLCMVKWDGLFMTQMWIFFILRDHCHAKQHDADFSRMVELNSSEHQALHIEDDVTKVLRKLEVFFTISDEPFIFATAWNGESLGMGMKTLMERSSTSIFIPPICDISVLYRCLFNRSNLRCKWFSNGKSNFCSTETAPTFCVSIR